MTKKSFPLSDVYRLLEPGPVVMLTTCLEDRSNIMTMSWHTMIEFEPPLVGCVISNRNYSFSYLNASNECVINIPTVEMAEQVIGCGNYSGREVDKFKQFNLTRAKALFVKTPLIDECYASLECKIVDKTLVEKNNFLFWRLLRHGSTRRVNTLKQYTIKVMAALSLMAKKFYCLPK